MLERQLCCDASIIPAVLGSKGEVLDLGRAVRWFTTAKVKTLGCVMVAAASRTAMPAHCADARSGT